MSIEQKIATFFDFLTVVCFIGMVIAFFQFTEREIPTLPRLLPPGITFAVANQLGNKGWTLLILALVAFGAVYYAALELSLSLLRAASQLRELTHR